MISSPSSLGYPIRNTETVAPLYNDNRACMKWCHNMTTKGNCHIKQRESAVGEWVANSTLTVLHVSGKNKYCGHFHQRNAQWCKILMPKRFSHVLLKGLQQAFTLGGLGKDLRNFQLVPIPILSILTLSTSSPHDILKVSKKNLP
jgi:hypothetical protein